MDTKQDAILEEELQKIGKNIQNFRKASGLSQQDLAERAGVERSYVSALERGKQNLTFGVLLKIANALETSIPSLLK
jgi:transcriptional regulator with XRE-family HTH domain